VVSNQYRALPLSEALGPTPAPCSAEAPRRQSRRSGSPRCSPNRPRTATRTRADEAAVTAEVCLRGGRDTRITACLSSLRGRRRTGRSENARLGVVSGVTSASLVRGNTAARVGGSGRPTGTSAT
jgi:hypothetical protein